MRIYVTYSGRTEHWPVGDLDFLTVGRSSRGNTPYVRLHDGSVSRLSLVFKRRESDKSWWVLNVSKNPIFCQRYSHQEMKALPLFQPTRVILGMVFELGNTRILVNE